MPAMIPVDPSPGFFFSPAYSNVITLEHAPCGTEQAKRDNVCIAWKAPPPAVLVRRPPPDSRAGEACDPKAPAPEGYECHDRTFDHPPPGTSW